MKNFFRNGAVFVFLDLNEGDNFTHTTTAHGLLRMKYLEPAISYCGVQHIETHSVPTEAPSEGLFDAIIREDDALNTPVENTVQVDKLITWNEGPLRHGQTKSCVPFSIPGTCELVLAGVNSQLFLHGLRLSSAVYA